jgi:hypothetical protein
MAAVMSGLVGGAVKTHLKGQLTSFRENRADQQSAVDWCAPRPPCLHNTPKFTVPAEHLKERAGVV